MAPECAGAEGAGAAQRHADGRLRLRMGRRQNGHWNPVREWCAALLYPPQCAPAQTHTTRHSHGPCSAHMIGLDVYPCWQLFDIED